MPKIVIHADRLKRQMRSAQRRSINLKPAFELIGEDWLQSIQRNFDAEGRPSRWPALHPTYRAARPSGKILTVSGRLRRSITKKADRSGVEVGTNVRYAAILQFGGKTRPHEIKPKRKKALFWPGARHPVRSVRHPGSVIPPRAFLVIQDEDWPTFEQSLQEYITGELSGR